MSNNISAFKDHIGLVAPLDIANVDTDAIIPKQFLQKITRTGFGQHLFHDWRFLESANQQVNPEFVLNLPRYQGASILLARENFGCGSSREHAPWALADFGFKIIIAPSFADIFYTNAINNQLLPVILSGSTIDALFAFVNATAKAKMTVNLEAQTVTAGENLYHFLIDPFQRHCLLKGLDSIDLTLQYRDNIAQYEANIPVFLL